MHPGTGHGFLSKVEVRGGSGGSSAKVEERGGSVVGDGGSGNSPSSSLKASAKVEGLGSQSSSEVESSDVEGRGSDSEVEGHTYELSWKGRGSVVKLLLQQHAGQNGIKPNPEKESTAIQKEFYVQFKDDFILFHLPFKRIFICQRSEPAYRVI